MVDHTSEELIYNIEADHKELQFMHKVFAEILGGIIEQAQEVYVRDEIAKGLSEVATPGWYYFDRYNDREGDRAELDQLCDAPSDDTAIIEPVHDEPDETHSYQVAFDAGYDKGLEDAAMLLKKAATDIELNRGENTCR